MRVSLLRNGDHSVSIVESLSVRFSGVTSRRVFTLLACSALLSACGGSKLSAMLAAPTIAQVTISAGEQLNVDSRGRSTPVVVRYYFLKSAAGFDAADFFSLYEKDQQTLGDALVQREEVILKAGETKVLEPRDAGEAQVVGVMVAFRDIEHAVWRATAPLAPNKVTAVIVSASGNQISVLRKVR